MKETFIMQAVTSITQSFSHMDWKAKTLGTVAVVSGTLAGVSALRELNNNNTNNITPEYEITCSQENKNKKEDYT